MYSEQSVQIPAAIPQQKPTPKPRSADKALDLVTTQHAEKRKRERGYSSEQVLQTYVHGHELPDPRMEPGVSHFVLNSVAHAQMRRRVVVDNTGGEILTVYPREPDAVTETPKAPPSNTKSKKKQQLAKKRARSTNG
jgi:hypothetical protein